MKIAIQNGIAATISTLFLLLPTSFDSFVLADHSYGHARKQTELTGDLPRSFSANNRLIGFVIQAKPNLDRYESLLLVIDEYLSMCEGGWNTTLRIFNTLNPSIVDSNWNGEMRRLIRYKTFCYRTNSYLPIEYYIQQPSKDPEVSSYSCLLALVRESIKLEISKKEFDVYVHNTDETLVKFSHVAAYLHESRKLSHALALQTPDETPPFSIGFQSYRRLLRVGEKHGESIDEASIVAQEMIERHPDTPIFHRVIVSGLSYMVVNTVKRMRNEDSPKMQGQGNNQTEEVNHCELWIMTKSEIEMELERNCLFESPPLYTGHFIYISRAEQCIEKTKRRFWDIMFPSLHYYDTLTQWCHTQKVVPIDHFFSFLVNHFYDTGDPMFPVYASYHTAHNDGTGTQPVWPTVIEVHQHLLMPHNISARF